VLIPPTPGVTPILTASLVARENEYLSSRSSPPALPSFAGTTAPEVSLGCYFYFTSSADDSAPSGLDASTALSYTQAIRTLTDVLGMTSVVTLYQAGNGIYELFDKIIVLDEGKQIYYGPREKAKPFYESLGFQYTVGANYGDFLTSCVVPSERLIRSGYEHRFPRTADDIRAAYQQTEIYQQMREEIGYADSEEARKNTEEFKAAVISERHKSLPRHSPLTVSFPKQILTLTRRQYQIIWGNKAAFIVRQCTCLVQALVAASLFYNIPGTATGLFLLGGTLFFSV
jgi:hypothetical protein